MSHAEWQRLLRGAALVGQELYRLHAGEARHASRLLRQHAAAVCATLPGTLLARPPPPAAAAATPQPAQPAPQAQPPPAQPLAASFVISDAAMAAAIPARAARTMPPAAAPPPPQSRPADAAVAASAASPSPAPPAAATPPRRRQFREVAVPASPLARVWGFGRLAASLAAGAAGESMSRVFYGAPEVAGGAAPAPSAPAASSAAVASASPSAAGAASSSVASAAAATSPAAAAPARAAQVPVLRISPAQAERLAEGLCRMRGAALKLGQMLSLSDETLVPPAIAAVLERVRTQADVMPARQLESVMVAELGANWRERLGGSAFELAPVAAASIGQVHRSVLAGGRRVAVKVQYPGVAASIQSDISNLKSLLTWAAFLPPGMYLDEVLAVAREELAAECDYTAEASKQERFRALVGGDADFAVPGVVSELSTGRVLVTDWLAGVPIDALAGPEYTQATRDAVARKLLKLTLRELFTWRFVQTDPNWGNYLYDAAGNGGAGVVGLLDFGAAREYPRAFVDDYLRLVWAAANGDAPGLRAISMRLGFLTGLETPAMVAAHIASGLVVGEPFAPRAGPFDFRNSGITRRVAAHGAVFADQRLTPPPPEVYSLHRKLAGAFLICIRMGATMHCRDLLEETYHTHQWGDAPAAAQ